MFDELASTSICPLLVVLLSPWDLRFIHPRLRRRCPQLRKRICCRWISQASFSSALQSCVSPWLCGGRAWRKHGTAQISLRH
ncbi:hypothetical protein K469DRAFT_298741 [Zopfia rhizophila CBS 207.26]|uniref:Uncharacterized protein n=1 Tax=Zopfia rhizophila CBS 207.26 TaxID=1314779 RepID=A0A6A6DMV4_9PEZI|nr:hypothetical protein K469DRAFT_298741 [Zopfia rhizophila CBS 207.26]